MTEPNSAADRIIFERIRDTIREEGRTSMNLGDVLTKVSALDDLRSEDEWRIAIAEAMPETYRAAFMDAEWTNIYLTIGEEADALRFEVAHDVYLGTDAERIADELAARREAHEREDAIA